MTLIIIAAIAAILVIWFIAVQRRLVSKEELCRNSMSQIGVQQNSRWDAVSALVELTRSYNEHEYNTLRDVIAMRRTTSFMRFTRSSAMSATSRCSALSPR